MNHNSGEKTVLVPVPERLLQDVYQLLADRMTKDQAGTHDDSPDESPHDLSPSLVPNGDRLDARAHWRQEFWTRERIEKAYLDLSPPAMKALMNTLADRPGEKLLTDDFAEAIQEATGKLKVDPKTVGGILGSFSRRLKSYFEVTIEAWPFVCERDFDLQRWYYLMTPEVAAMINELRESRTP